MILRPLLLAATLGLSGFAVTGCVDDGYRRPGLVVVEDRPLVRRDYRSYDRYDRYDRRYDRYDRRYERRPYRGYDRYGDDRRGPRDPYY